MGRHRLHNDVNEPLPRGLYKHGRKWRAFGPNGEYVYFGPDYAGAISGYVAWRKSRGGDRKTVSWLLDLCIGQAWPGKVVAKQLAPRTLKDYTRDAAILKVGLGAIPLVAVQPKHIATFRDARAKDAPSHVRNEMACLSSALSYAVENGHLAANPALEVARPRKQVRDRLIDDGEFLAVYAKAIPSVRLAMTLAVRTLALPADLLSLGPRNVVRYADGRRTVRFDRGKTSVKVEVEVLGDLAVALQPFLDNPSLHPSFVRRDDGQPYTVDGIGAMFRRYCIKAGVADFGLRDLRAKGATEMYRAGIDIRQIQKLLGHKSVQTTEIYLKRLLAEIVRPNEQPIIASVK